MSALGLEAIKARCEAATAGPWQMTRNSRDAVTVHREKFLAFDTEIALLRDLADTEDAPARDKLLADGDFIAHARTDVPALVAEVERLRDDYEGACELVAQMHAAAVGGKVGDGPRLGVLEDVVAAQRAVVKLSADIDRLCDERAAERLATQRALAAAQADSARLRAALKAIARDGCTRGGCCNACGAGEDEDCKRNCCKLVARTALAAPAGDDALREFGLRVAVVVHENEGNGTIAGSLPELVDAVLRGGDQ